MDKLMYSPCVTEKSVSGQEAEDELRKYIDEIEKLLEQLKKELGDTTTQKERGKGNEYRN